MAYASLDEVQRRMPQFALSESTKPTTETAQEFLDATEAQFDSAMDNLGYVVPLSGKRSLAQAKEIVCQGAICQILTARAAAVGTDVAMQSADRACKKYDEALAKLADPESPIELTDAERTDNQLEKPGGGEPQGHGGDPRFFMTSKF